MKWLEVSVETVWAEDNLPSELVTAVLMDLGITGVQTEDAYETRLFLENNPNAWDYADAEALSALPGKTVLRFYLNDTQTDLLAAAEEAVNNLKNGEFACALGSLAVSSRTVDDDGWADGWKKYYKPFRIGERLVIRPLWEDFAPSGGDVVLALNPGQVFGTGLHQTTRMCLEALDALSMTDKFNHPPKILDIGCGSGILTLAALLLWPGSSATALDIDAAAARVVRENAEANGLELERLRFLTGNIIEDKALFETIRGEYDIVLANIVADAVMAIAPLAAGLLSPDGLFISSGIIRGRLDEVADCYRRNGLSADDVRVDGEWVSVVSDKQDLKSNI